MCTSSAAGPTRGSGLAAASGSPFSTPHGEITGVRSGQYGVPEDMRPQVGARDAICPYRVVTSVEAVASKVDEALVKRLTAAYLAAPDVGSAYFLFLRDVDYIVDFGVVGMTLRGVSPSEDVLRHHEYIPPLGMPQYGALQRRLHLPRSAHGRHRPTRWERGYGEIVQPGSWAGDFSPAWGYYVYVCEQGLMLVPRPEGDTTMDNPQIPDGFGDVLGRVTVGLPGQGCESSSRIMTYTCY